MGVVASVVAEILQLQGPGAYALVGGLAFAEAALLVGFVLPGETAVLLGGVLANQDRVSLVAIAAIAVTGDSVGYPVGRHFGPRVIELKLLARRRAELERGLASVRRNGGRAVFLARFTAFFRALMPGLAGAARMPYRRFLVFNAAGGFIWAVGFTFLGFAAGAGYRSVERIAGRASEVILAVVAVGILAFVLWRRHKEAHGTDA